MNEIEFEYEYNLPKDRSDSANSRLKQKAIKFTVTLKDEDDFHYSIQPLHVQGGDHQWYDVTQLQQGKNERSKAPEGYKSTEMPEQYKLSEEQLKDINAIFNDENYWKKVPDITASMPQKKLWQIYYANPAVANGENEQSVLIQTSDFSINEKTLSRKFSHQKFQKEYIVGGKSLPLVDQIKFDSNDMANSEYKEFLEDYRNNHIEINVAEEYDLTETPAEVEKGQKLGELRAAIKTYSQEKQTIQFANVTENQKTELTKMMKKMNTSKSVDLPNSTYQHFGQDGNTYFFKVDAEENANFYMIPADQYMSADDVQNMSDIALSECFFKGANREDMVNRIQQGTSKELKNQNKIILHQNIEANIQC